jgi:hypothetical protein
MVTIKGVTESSTANNIKLEASAGSTTLATVNFTVVEVMLSLRYGNNLEVSPDNAKLNNWVLGTGTKSLGLLFSNTDQLPKRWRTCVEIVGSVKPTNFTGAITLVREWDYRAYNNQTLIDSATAKPDTSKDTFRDDDPQSGGSNGKVYDLDGPGYSSIASDPVGAIFRLRNNFRQWAVISGTNNRLSSTLEWFSRVSITKMSSGDVLNDDVTGDNTAGTGTTPLSWNLQ